MSPTLQNGIAASESPLSSPVSWKTPNLLSSELIENCLTYFFENLYPTMPILHRTQTQQCVLEMEFSVEAYCLICSLCAFIVIHPGLHTVAQRGKAANSFHPHGQRLLEEAIHVRKCYDHVENHSVLAVTTSFFLSATYAGMTKHNAAWFHLREAITLAQLLGMQSESSYTPLDLESTMRRRMFWMLFMYER